MKIERFQYKDLIQEFPAPINSRGARPGEKRTGFKGVTIHNTDNTAKDSGALSHARYLNGSGSVYQVSWHYAVDDKLITRSIPEDEIAWCNHDGRGNGNMKTINIEICMNPESVIYNACNNAGWLTADILLRNGIKTARGYVFQHHDWYDKNCPSQLRGNLVYKTGNDWNVFMDLVQWFIDELIARGEYK